MRTAFLSLSLLSTALVACSGDEPPAPSEVRERIATDLRYVLTEAKAAIEGSTKNLPSGSAFSFASGALETTGLARVMPASLTKEPTDRLFADGDESSVEIDPDALIELLNERLFTDRNHLGNGIFKVPADLVCEETSYDPDTGTESYSIDPECAQKLQDAQLRIRVAKDDGLQFAIQVDANHDEPLLFTLRSDELAVTLDLDEATDAMVALAPLFGEQAPNAKLAGQITGSLKILGTAHAKLAVTFDRALSIAVADAGIGLDSEGAFRFTSAAGNILTTELDGKGEKAKLALGLGETTVHVPGDELDPAAMDLVLGGATVDASLEGSTLKLDNISLGTKTTRMSIGGQQAYAIDLNANDGRTLSATLSADPVTGHETLTVSPRLDLQIAVNHDLLGEETPVYDVTRVQLEGTLKSWPIGNQIEVVSGSLALTTNPAEYGFTATAGQCVTATEHYDEETFRLWTQYSVGACTSARAATARDAGALGDFAVVNAAQ